MSDPVTAGLKVGELVVTLGLEVYKAIKAGDTAKTVGEIYEGVRTDWSEIERLEKARFGARPTEPPENPFDEGE